MANRHSMFVGQDDAPDRRKTQETPRAALAEGQSNIAISSRSFSAQSDPTAGGRFRPGETGQAGQATPSSIRQLWGPSGRFANGSVSRLFSGPMAVQAGGADATDPSMEQSAPGGERASGRLDLAPADTSALDSTEVRQAAAMLGAGNPVLQLDSSIAESTLPFFRLGSDTVGSAGAASRPSGAFANEAGVQAMFGTSAGAGKGLFYIPGAESQKTPGTLDIDYLRNKFPQILGTGGQS